MQENLHTSARKALPYLPILPGVSSQSTSHIDAPEFSSFTDGDSSCSQIGQKRLLNQETPRSRKKRRVLMRKLRQCPVAHGSTKSPAVAVSVHAMSLYFCL